MLGPLIRPEPRRALAPLASSASSPAFAIATVLRSHGDVNIVDVRAGRAGLDTRRPQPRRRSGCRSAPARRTGSTPPRALAGMFPRRRWLPRAGHRVLAVRSRDWRLPSPTCPAAPARARPRAQLRVSASSPSPRTVTVASPPPRTTSVDSGTSATTETNSASEVGASPCAACQTIRHSSPSALALSAAAATAAALSPMTSRTSSSSVDGPGSSERASSAARTDAGTCSLLRNAR